MIDYRQQVIPLLILKKLVKNPETEFTVLNLMDELEKEMMGSRMERRTIYKAIDALIETGYPVNLRNGRSNAKFIKLRC